MSHAWQWLLAGTAALVVSSGAAASRTSSIPTYGYQIVRTYPHDATAFTQGLFYKDGFLYESTGRVGQSSVRKVRLETGEVLLKTDLPPRHFGEGITYWDQRLIALTWFSQVGFVFDLESFALLRRFSYSGEGWGLTRNDRLLIMSDGTAQLRFLDPQTLSEVRRVRVKAYGKPVARINELEWVEGEIFANIWKSDRIARIDPDTGRVVGWIDLTGLLPASERLQSSADVLNGIAYDPSTRRLFVTGKLWPTVFEIRLLQR